MLGNAASLWNALLTVVFNFVKKFKTNHGPREYNKTVRAVVSILIQPHCNMAMCLIYIKSNFLQTSQLCFSS